MDVEPTKPKPQEGLRHPTMTKPTQIDPRAERVLTLLTGKREAREIVLGGYFALKHYTDYRRTHDIDAWWKTRANAETEQVIRTAMQQVATEDGFELRERRFGETVSFELVRGTRKEFSFQITVRSFGLEEPVASVWPPVLIETLADNLASKMTALVDRGAPRDFIDIKHVVNESLITVPGLWDLWCQRNPRESVDSGKQKVLLHLMSIEGRRPLESIQADAERERAKATRDWFKQEFLER
jgi:hypothetical protein